MTPKEHSITPHVSGDSWEGIDLISIAINGAPPLFPLASAKIQFRRTSLGSVALTLDTANNSIVIEDAALWQISVPSRVVAIDPGDYCWDLQTIDTNGQIKTYLKGVWPILEDITR